MCDSLWHIKFLCSRACRLKEPFCWAPLFYPHISVLQQMDPHYMSFSKSFLIFSSLFWVLILFGFKYFWEGSVTLFLMQVTTLSIRILLSCFQNPHDAASVYLGLAWQGGLRGKPSGLCGMGVGLVRLDWTDPGAGSTCWENVVPQPGQLCCTGTGSCEGLGEWADKVRHFRGEIVLFEVTKVLCLFEI